MRKSISGLLRIHGWIAASFFIALIAVSPASAQPKSQQPVSVPSLSPATEKDLATTQEQLIKLLRLSPTLTTVVARDPSLLANQEYVRHNNPQLAQFLQGHPEIALNPEFYLFTHLPDEDGRHDQALERAVWPELSQPRTASPLADRLLGDAGPVLVFLAILITLIWLIKLFVENRRWSRIFKLQTEVHGKLIDKFSSNDELLVYMNTEAGKRFLEAAPIPINFEHSQPVPSAVARVLMPLQIGIVLSLVGAGLLAVRRASVEFELPMLFLGTLILMPGVGFILSAGVTWLLAGRLGLMPTSGTPADRTSGSTLDLKGRE